jgi:MFS family permease
MKPCPLTLVLPLINPVQTLTRVQPIIGPVIGPVAGGYLGQAAGWRWIFWLITIVGGVALAVSVLVLRES